MFRAKFERKGATSMSKSTGTKAVSLFAAVIFCMLFTQTAFAVETVTPAGIRSNSVVDTDVSSGNGIKDIVVAGDVIENTTPTNNQVDPSFDSEYIIAGNKVSITASFTNKGNETITLTPKLVAIPNSQYNINEDWVKFSPESATVAPGSIHKFEVIESIPENVESGTYQGQIVFTDDRLPNSTDYINSMKLSITVQSEPKIELQTTYLSDTVQAGKEYKYRVNIKNIADSDVTIDPQLTSYNSGYGQAFSNDRIEISAPSTIKVGESANMSIKIRAPENISGAYYGSIDMNVDEKPADGSNPQLGLSLNVWKQPVTPFVKTFNTVTNAPITVEISSEISNSALGLRVSPKEEKPSFKLGLTRNSKNVNMAFLKSVESGTVNIGSSYQLSILADKNNYQNNNEHYAETYTVSGAKGDWKLSILPKNTNNFGYSIALGDTSSKK